MLKRLIKSPYVKAMLAFVAGGIILIVIYNALRNTHIANGIATVNDVLMPVYIGIGIAFLLCPIYNRLVRRLYARLRKVELESGMVSSPHFGEIDPELLYDAKGREFRRCLSIAKAIASILSVCIVLAFFALIGYFVLPELVGSIIDLINTMPEKLQAFSDWTAVHLSNFPQISKWINDVADAGSSEVIALIRTYAPSEDLQSLATELSTRVWQVVMALVDLLIGLIISVYLLNYKETIFANARKIIAATCSEKRAGGLYEFAHIINETFIGYIVGRILDALVIWALTYLCMRLLGMPLPFLVSAIVGVTNVIPFFGPFLGAIPSFCLLMLEDPIQACYFAILILIIQQLDGNVIGPKIVGNAIGISSFWVLIAVLVGGGFFGFLGMALATPVFTVFYRYAGKFTDSRLARRQRSTDLLDYIDYDKFGVDREEFYRGKRESQKNGK